MRKPHIAFMVESAHGHVNPILGISSALVNRGCRVSCAVEQYFARRVTDSGAEPVIYEPWSYKTQFLPKAQKCAQDDAAQLRKLWEEFEHDGVDNDLPQLRTLYQDDKPDLIIYDFRNLAGKALASLWSIPKLEHAPMLIENNEQSQLGGPYDENLVIVSIPRFLQRNADELDERFHFVGPIYGSRTFFQPWNPKHSAHPTVVVSASTALLQPEFFKIVIHALEGLACEVILSIGDEIDPDSLGSIPAHFQTNRFSSHLDLLGHASLFIAHGGPGSTLEAIYSGVPTLLITPHAILDQIALRVAELGAGIRLSESAVSVDKIRKSAAFLLTDNGTRERVRALQSAMRATDSAKLATDLILERLPGN